MNWIQRFLTAIATHKADASAHHTKFDIFDKFREFIPWVSLDGFTVGGDVGYAVNAKGALLELVTAATANDAVYLHSTGYYANLLDIGKVITWEFPLCYLSSVANQNIWLRLTTTVTIPPTEIERHIGWKIINGDLYASNADIATQAITDTLVDLAAVDQRTRLKVVFTPGTDCKYYVNNVLKVTHTTFLPTATFYRLLFYLKTLENASHSMELGRMLLEKEHA